MLCFCMLCLLGYKSTNSICVVAIGVIHFSVCVTSVTHTFYILGGNMMENNISKKRFMYSKDICEEVRKKIKQNMFLLVINFILGAIFLYFCVQNYEQQKLVIIFPIIAAISIFSSFNQLKEWANIYSNITKNNLEIDNTYICGTYTEDLKVVDRERYFKIQCDAIDKMEIKHPNYSAKMCHNLYIYCGKELIKLTIEKPHEIFKIVNSSKSKTE